MIKHGVIFLSVLLLLSLSGVCFGQDDPAAEPDYKAAYLGLKSYWIQLSEKGTDFLPLVGGLLQISTDWADNLQDLKSSSTSLTILFNQGYSDLKDQSSEIKKSITNISVELKSLNSIAENLGPLLNQVTSSLNQLKKAYRRDLIKAVVISSGISIAVTTVVIILVSRFVFPKHQ